MSHKSETLLVNANPAISSKLIWISQTKIKHQHSNHTLGQKKKKKINLTPQSLLHLQKNQTSTPQTPTKVHKHQVQTTVDGHNQVKHKSQSTDITNPNTKIKHPPNKSSFFKKKKKKKKKITIISKKKRNLTCSTLNMDSTGFSLVNYLKSLDTNYSFLYLLSLIMCERVEKNNC